MFTVRKSRYWGGAVVVAAALMLSAATGALPVKDESVEQLKARLPSLSIGDRPQVCILIAEKQLDVADKLYSATESEKAQEALGDVTTFAELARDYSIQSHKHQKQTEIMVRRMAHKLSDLKHAVIHDDQAAVQSAIQRLQRVSDDLLMAMFPKGQK
jgi:hypothetical protein